MFPLLAEAELSRRLGSIRLHRFSYFARTPPDWPYPVTSLADLPEMIGELDGLLIGGGHLIRFDTAVAPGYFPPTPAIHHPTGYWLTPALLALDRGCPVAWNAPGMYGDVPPWAEPLVHLVMRRSAYVAVRDEPARDALARFAGDREIAVVPDTAFGIAGLLGHESLGRAARLREALGLTRPYVVIQPHPQIRPACRFLRARARLMNDYQWVSLPMGPALGDDHALLRGELPDLACTPDDLDPVVSAELIRAAAGVVGMSLHLSITAVAFGVPVLRPRDELRKFEVLSRFGGVSFFDDGEIDPAWLTEPRRPEGEDVLSDARARLDRHWDTIARLVEAGPAVPRPPEGLGTFWQGLPGLLEGERTEEGSSAISQALAALAESRAALAASRAETTVARGELVALRNSACYKMTAPLRWINHLVSGRLREKDPP